VGETHLSQADTRGHIDLVSHWRWPALLALICFVSVLISFRQTLLSMEYTWYSSRTFSHCFLIFPLFLYLVWIRRGTISALHPASNYWGLPLLAVFAVLWLLANIGEVAVVQEFMLVAIVVALVWTLLGTSVVRTIAFPLAFLFFAVPFGNSLIGPLQDFTAWFAVNALTLSNIPAVLENRILSVPSGAWTVAEACSGIRYLFSSVALATIYASLVYRSRRRQLVFIFASIIVPIAANGVRAYGVVLLAYLTDNRLAIGVDHVVYGWLFFTTVQVTLFAVGMRWRERSSQKGRDSTSSVVARTALPSCEDLPRKRSLIVASAALLLVVPAPLVAAHLWTRAAVSAGLSEPDVCVTPPWQAAPASDMSWVPDLRDPDEKFSQSYESGQHRVGLYWALYSDRHRMELVGDYNFVVNPRLWSSVTEGFEHALIGGQSIRVHQTLMESSMASRSVWTWYWVNGEYTASPVRVKFLQAKARLSGRPTSATVIAVGTDYQMGASEAKQVLQDFLSHTSLFDHVTAVANR
jgi:exosortase A